MFYPYIMIVMKSYNVQKTIQYLSMSIIMTRCILLPTYSQNISIPPSITSQCVTEIWYIQTCHSYNNIVFTMNILIKKLFLSYESRSTSVTQLKTSVNGFIERVNQVKQILINKKRRNSKNQFVIEYLEYICLLYLDIINDTNQIKNNASMLFGLTMDQEALQESELQLLSISLYDQNPAPKSDDNTVTVNLKVHNTTSRQINSIQSIDCVTGTSYTWTILPLQIPPFTLRENRITNIIPTISIAKYFQTAGTKSITCSIDRVDLDGIRQRTAYQTLNFEL